MAHRPGQEEITEKPTGSIDTSTTDDTAKLPNNTAKYDGWKEANQKQKTRRGDPIKSAILKFTGRCTGLSGFIYDLGLNQTNECIEMTLEIEEYAGRTYGTEVRKSSNELESKVSMFIKPEDLTVQEDL